MSLLTVDLLQVFFSPEKKRLLFIPWPILSFSFPSYPVGDSSTLQLLSQMQCTSLAAQWTITSEVGKCTGSR